MISRDSSLSIAEARRPAVAAAALDQFSQGGLHGTTVADVARAAKISPAYVFKLFPGKEALFVAAMEVCFADIIDALEHGADAATERTPESILDAMGEAYAELISDRRLLMMQVHAQSVADIAEVGDALRAGLAKITRFAKTRSRGSDDAVQRFIAYGQLCHLIATAGLDELPDEWAVTLSHNMRHPG